MFSVAKELHGCVGVTKLFFIHGLSYKPNRLATVIWCIKRLCTMQSSNNITSPKSPRQGYADKQSYTLFVYKEIVLGR